MSLKPQMYSGQSPLVNALYQEYMTGHILLVIAN
jgi:hypothetical protein